MKHARTGQPVGRRRRAVLIGGFAVVLTAAVGLTATAFAAGTASLQADRGPGWVAHRVRSASFDNVLVSAAAGPTAASWALAGEKTPVVAPPAVISSASPSPSGRPSVTSHPHSAAPSAHSLPPSSPPSSPAMEVRGHPGDTQVEKGSLRSDGSTSTAGQSTVTLKAAADLTALDLTIRVAQTPGLTDKGGTDSVTTSGVTVTVEKQGVRCCTTSC